MGHTKRARRLAAWAWAGVCAAGATGAAAQAMRPAERDAAEQHRVQQRNAVQHERLVPPVDAGAETGATPADTALPAAETPCFTLHRIAWQLPDDLHWPWLAAAVHADGDDPIGHCVGALGLAALAQRAQNAVLERGYITSRVLVEPQDIARGELTLTVLPGRVGRVRLADPMDDRATLANALPLPLRPGQVLNLREIEQALENLKRLPTVQADIELVPGEAPATSDVVVRWQQALPLRLTLSVDDSGSEKTGRYQASATLSLDHGLTLNDLLYVSAGRNLDGGGPAPDGIGDVRGTRVNTLHYSLPWGHWLFAWQASRSQYHQRVGDPLGGYRYAGRARHDEWTASRLLRRDRHSKTQFSASAFAQRSRNFIEDAELFTQGRRTGGWSLGLEHRTRWHDTTAELQMNLRRGTGAFGARGEPVPGGDTARYGLLSLALRLQGQTAWAGQPLRWRSHWRGQRDHTPLAAQERFAIGGRYTVRGFDGVQSLSGERGWLVRNELGLPFGDGAHEVYLGLDHGRVGGPAARALAGRHLTGAVLGWRGSPCGGCAFELFAGLPLRPPEGFGNSHSQLGFSWIWSTH